MNNLALTLWNQGDLAGARQLQETAVDALKRVLGEAHPSTVAALDSLQQMQEPDSPINGGKEQAEKKPSLLSRVARFFRR